MASGASSDGAKQGKKTRKVGGGPELFQLGTSPDDVCPCWAAIAAALYSSWKCRELYTALSSVAGCGVTMIALASGPLLTNSVNCSAPLFPINVFWPGVGDTRLL